MCVRARQKKIKVFDARALFLLLELAQKWGYLGGFADHDWLLWL